MTSSTTPVQTVKGCTAFTPSQPFQTPQTVGDTLGISVRTVTELCTKGEIPAVKIGRQWRIPTNWLLSVMDAA